MYKDIFFSKKSLIFIIFVSICLQFNEVKIFHIKLSEIALIISSFFFLSANLKINKYIFWFLIFFFFLLIKTIIQNFFTTFYINAPLPLLRQPYFISLSRFLELYCCIVFTYVVGVFLKRLPPIKVLQLVDIILKVQIYLVGSILFIVYSLYAMNILKLNGLDGFFVYNTTGYGEVSYRLKGLFIEGGPFGLFYAFLYTIYDWVLKQRNKNDWIGKLFIILIIFFASSKAGYSLMIVFFAINIYNQAKKSRYSFILKKVSLPAIVVGSLIVLFYTSNNYVELFRKGIEPSQSEDQAMVMGRVSGMIISPNMIINHYIMGIGLGNYPLVRNNPLYLSYFPQISVDLWDSSGLGGLIDLMVDGGCVFFIFFIFILYKLYKDVQKTNKLLLPLMLSFILPFVFGVQLFYLYPWFSLSLITYFMEKGISEKKLICKL